MMEPFLTPLIAGDDAFPETAHLAAAASIQGQKLPGLYADYTVHHTHIMWASCVASARCLAETLTALASVCELPELSKIYRALLPREATLSTQGLLLITDESACRGYVSRQVFCLRLFSVTGASEGGHDLSSAKRAVPLTAVIIPDYLLGLAYRQLVSIVRGVHQPESEHRGTPEV